jgi:hypothetical protein
LYANNTAKGNKQKNWKDDPELVFETMGVRMWSLFAWLRVECSGGLV